jgi:oxalate decarboxylase/phosphoglucose isomerase-like protein (cupin superfamily)
MRASCWFEKTLTIGVTSRFHLHRDSDEVSRVLAGEVTFMVKALGGRPLLGRP